MDELAQIVRRTLGLKWTSGNVSAIESGTSSVTITNLLILSYALGKLRGTPIGPFELLAFEGRAKTGIKDLTIWDDDFRMWFQTGEVELKLSAEDAARAGEMIRSPDFVDQLKKSVKESFKGIPRDAPFDVGADVLSSPTEDRIARSMEIEAWKLRYWANALWGRDFEAERDERAGSGATAQKKGRITRELKAQIMDAYNKEIEKHDGEG